MTGIRSALSPLRRARAVLEQLSATPNELRARGLNINQDGARRTARELLRHPGIRVESLVPLWPELAEIDKEISIQVETDAAYSGYLDRQESDIRAFRKDESIALPEALDYGLIPGLSSEVRDKIKTAKPATLGAAARISGVTPSALMAILAHIKRRPEKLTA